MDSIIIRPFKFQDTLDLVKWGKYNDPRLLHYNFPYVNSKDLKQWYRSKHQPLKRWIYAIILTEADASEKVVGYITLKHINWLFRYGEMGIVINPDYIGMGIGKIAIRQYLEHVYSKFPLCTIFLRVAAFNYRAQKCYTACGFEVADIRFEEYEEQENAQKILDVFPYFKEKSGILYTDYIYMRSIK